MRRAVPIAIFLLAICSGPIAAQTISLSISPRSQSYPANPGPATFAVTVTPVGGFSATVNLNVLAPALPGISYKISTSKVNAPYTQSINVTVDPQSAHMPGRYPIIVRAGNGPVNVADTCYIEIPETRGWKTYTTANSPLPTNDIRVMAVDRDGTGWLGLDTALVRFDKHTWQILSGVGLADRHLDTHNIHGHDSITGRVGILSLAIDSSNGVWAGLSSGGVVLIKDGQWTRFLSGDTTLPNGQVTSIAVSRTGDIWFNVDGKLVRFGGGTWTDIAGGVAGKLAVDHDNVVWIGIDDRSKSSVNRYDGTFWSTDVVDIAHQKLFGLTVDRDNRLVVATDYGITIRQPGTGLLEQPTVDGISRVSPPASIDIDDRGNLWVGTSDLRDAYAFGMGLSMFNGSTSTRYTVFNSGLPDQRVWQVRAGRDGTIWMLTNIGGLTLFDPSVAAGVPAAPESAHAAARIETQPNPMTAEGIVSIGLARSCDVRVALCDALGREVALLVDGPHAAGRIDVPVATGSLAAGRYYVHCRAGGIISAAPLVVVH